MASKPEQQQPPPYGAPPLQQPQPSYGAPGPYPQGGDPYQQNAYYAPGPQMGYYNQQPGPYDQQQQGPFPAGYGPYPPQPGPYGQQPVGYMPQERRGGPVAYCTTGPVVGIVALAHSCLEHRRDVGSSEQ
ncbi:hypothetical protein B0I35DRAFT_403669 [Stachybotrys elegans]|uniref:Cysteine-rich transmembrane CYSTM domain-containing protein n=1 Tax=Stachybotrys elegans TaxID=80388 RepID=A0A8K0T6Z6_9HYPO|nr:hypothetical protein B0I35DRAFT_403669 [Stachybotrys elegans]